ncbi:MAG: site-specific DNA-methyltransferase [Spirochaetota bacterium]
MSIQEVYPGNCLEILEKFSDESVDLVYLDPPFFTQKIQKLGTRDRTKEFQFSDTWESIDAYEEFIHKCLQGLHRVLRPSGSIFFHCDRNASYIARFLLDKIFGPQMFRAEIIWYYRRWSNSQKNLLPCHQNILFYSKTENYKFNEILQDYSSATNVDQILQRGAGIALEKRFMPEMHKGKPYQMVLRKVFLWAMCGISHF